MIISENGQKDKECFALFDVSSDEGRARREGNVENEIRIEEETKKNLEVFVINTMLSGRRVVGKNPPNVSIRIFRPSGPLISAPLTFLIHMYIVPRCTAGLVLRTIF